MREPSTCLILYGTSACHLCEIAEAMLISVGECRPALQFEKVDISDSDELLDRYGVSIPVLRHPGGAELAWPFSSEDLLRFL